MDRKDILSALLATTNAAGVGHTGLYEVAESRATIVLHRRLPDAAKRKMRRAWARLKKDSVEMPPLRIKTHRLAYQ